MKSTLGKAILGACIAASIIGSAHGEETSGRQRCDFYKAFACSAVKCWDNTALPAWSIVDWQKRTYSICDNTGCQTVQFAPWPDGIYVSMSFPQRDIMVKINETDQSIVETATLFNGSVTSFGNCARDDGP